MSVINYFERRTAKNPELTITTMKGQLAIIGSFQRFAAEYFHVAEEMVDVTKIDDALMIKYFNHLNSKLKPRSIRLYKTVLRCYFNECMEMGLIEKHPMANITNGKLKAPEPEAYPLAELRQTFLDVCRNDRERLFITLISYTGMRIGEVSRLTWDKIDETNNIIYVNDQKRKKIRKVPIAPQLKIFLMANRNGHLPYLYLEKKEGNMKVSQLHKMVYELRDRAGMPDVTCHTFRRSVGTHLLDQGVSPKIVASILGQDVKTLLVYYAGVSNESKGNAAALL